MQQVLHQMVPLIIHNKQMLSLLNVLCNHPINEERKYEINIYIYIQVISYTQQNVNSLYNSKKKQQYLNGIIELFVFNVIQLNHFKMFSVKLHLHV